MNKNKKKLEPNNTPILLCSNFRSVRLDDNRIWNYKCFVKLNLVWLVIQHSTWTNRLLNKRTRERQQSLLFIINNCTCCSREMFSDKYQNPSLKHCNTFITIQLVLFFYSNFPIAIHRINIKIVRWKIKISMYTAQLLF